MTTSLPLRSPAIAACAFAFFAAPVCAQAPATTKVGPPNGGAVIVVGGGGQGPEVFAKLIELAGGPDALILDVPTAGGDSVYPADWRGQNGLRAAGAKNVKVLHTKDRRVADSDEFVAQFKGAKGIWFEGGRHFHLVDSYLGTKTEKLFHDILASGGVASGSSAGASILGSYLVRGAPSNNNNIMSYPGYEVGFGFLRNVGIDQHVVARERLADLADSVMKRHPDLLTISEDEGTAWVVQGDIAEIIGRNKAFVYGGRDATDPGKPFLTLHPGDKYNLATRRVIHRAIEETALTQKFVDDVFASFKKPGGGQATVVVAKGGKVLVNSSYNVPPQRKFMPETTMPNFELGEISQALDASMLMASLRATAGRGAGGRAGGAGGAGGRGGRGGAGRAAATDDSVPLAPMPSVALTLNDTVVAGVSVREYLSHTKTVANGPKAYAAIVGKQGGQTYSQLANTRIYTPIGMHKTEVDANGNFKSNVDELYRFELGLTANRGLTESEGVNVFAPVAGGTSGNALGWRVDSYHGAVRQAAYGTGDGKRAAFMRFPDTKAAIIILTDNNSADAKLLAEKIADKLLGSK